MKQCISYLQTTQLRGVLYNILIDFGIHMNLVGLINMCRNETCGKFRVGKRLTCYLSRIVCNKEMLYRYCFSALL
jgi:hypothetical protein